MRKAAIRLCKAARRGLPEETREEAALLGSTPDTIDDALDPPVLLIEPLEQAQIELRRPCAYLLAYEAEAVAQRPRTVAALREAFAQMVAAAEPVAGLRERCRAWARAASDCAKRLSAGEDARASVVRLDSDLRALLDAELEVLRSALGSTVPALDAAVALLADPPEALRSGMYSGRLESSREELGMRRERVEDELAGD